MFGKTSGAPGAGGSGALSVLGADVTVTGDIASHGDLHVDGTVLGDIACHALVQGSSGRVVGTVRGQNVRLAGTVEGAVSAERLLLEASARIDGDVTYGAIAIQEGAVIDGRITHAADAGTAVGDSGEAMLRLVEGAAS